MASNRGISLRYKILGMMTAIPFFTLATYLYLASSVFKEDKIAYVFETSMSVSHAMASQVRSELTGVLNVSRALFQDYLNTKSFLGVSPTVFKSESNLQLVAAFESENGKFQKRAVLERTSGEAQEVLASLPQLETWLNEASKEGRLIKGPFGDDRLLIIERAGVPGQTQVVLFVLVSHLRELRDLFTRPSTTETFLTNADGSVIFGPEKKIGKFLTEDFEVKYLQDAKEKKSFSGTVNITDKKGEELLVSYASATFGDLNVTSTVVKAKALNALNKLLHKSFWFFGVLVTITAIISLIASGTLTSALTLLYEATKRVAEGNFNVRVNVKSADEIGGLADSFNLMAAEVARLLEETASKARMEAELKTAQTVQETLFPPNQADLGGFKISGLYEPASECGGDWWHYCKVGEKIFIWIGDATGHGAPAALITSAARSASTIIERLDGVGPGKALELLNRAIFDVSKGRIMMTFFVAAFDPKNQTFTYANASHDPPYLIKQGEAAPKKKDLQPLNEVNNPRLGQSRETQYQEYSFPLEKGDSVIFYTDGIPDIHNKKQEPWGEREFIKAILAANVDYPSAHEVVTRLSEKFITHRQQAPLIDDITFVVCKYEGQA